METGKENVIPLRNKKELEKIAKYMLKYIYVKDEKKVNNALDKSKDKI